MLWSLSKVNVRACFDEQINHGDAVVTTIATARVMQGRPAVVHALIHVGSAGKQHAHKVHVSRCGYRPDSAQQKRLWPWFVWLENWIFSVPDVVYVVRGEPFPHRLDVRGLGRLGNVKGHVHCELIWEVATSANGRQSIDVTQHCSLSLQDRAQARISKRGPALKSGFLVCL